MTHGSTITAMDTHLTDEARVDVALLDLELSNAGTGVAPPSGSRTRAERLGDAPGGPDLYPALLDCDYTRR